MGSSDVAEVSNFLPAHVNGLQDEAKIPASNGLESHQVFTTGPEENAVIPPLLPESRKDNKGVPWYDSYSHSSFVQPRYFRLFLRRYMPVVLRMTGTIPHQATSIR